MNCNVLFLCLNLKKTFKVEVFFFLEVSILNVFCACVCVFECKREFLFRNHFDLKNHTCLKIFLHARLISENK